MKLFATALIGVVISTSAVSGMLQGSPGNDIARSNLPPCPSFGYFHNCFGTYIEPNNGRKYVGEWRDGKWNGRGNLNFPLGDNYVGGFKDNNRNGQGNLYFGNGKRYFGEWKEDNFHGYGTLYAPDRSIINQGIWAEGKFVRSVPVQQATEPNQENERLRAEADEAKRKQAEAELPPCPSSGYRHNCFGTFTFADGEKYVGEFKDDKRNGQGTATFASGSGGYVGEWKDGKYNGQGTHTFKGSKYVGEFKDYKRDGQGTLTFATGQKYVGEFKNDIWHGQGTFTFSDGTVYVGEYKDGKYNGRGTLYASNGSIINQGIWADGTFVRSAPVQQATIPNQENERLRAEAAEAKRKQAAAEEKMRDAQLLALQNRENERLRAQAAEAKRKQAEAEEKTLVAQQQTTLTPPVTIQATIPTGKRVALVVGNKNYKVRPLQNTLNDADDISRSLRTSGFEVIDLRDATLPQMRTAVRQFGDKLLTYDVGLVYYSGHGVEVKGRNYFIPVNADIQREDEIADQGLDVSLILEKMSTAGKGVNILIVDACRDDPFGRSFRSTSRGLAQMDAPRGTIIAYSTSPGKVASDGDTRERNSPYTKHLLRAMQSPNKPIEQVFKEVRRAVQDETKNQQTPWENTSLSGDFFFKVQR
jgi:hypothetical protein